MYPFDMVEDKTPQRIRDLMVEKKLTYSDLSTLTGISKSTLQRYATGTTARIPANRLRQIASALGVTVDYLLNIKPPRAVDPNETEAEREERLGLPKGTFKRIAASKKAKKNINTSEDDLKFALFGCEDVSDEAFEDVKRYAEWIKEKHKLDKEKEQH